MQTQSHFLLTAVANDVLRSRGVPVRSRALLLGSFMPDVGLLVLTLGYGAYRFWIGPTFLGQAPPAEHLFGAEYDRRYFTDPLWITVHNALHAPLLLLAYSLIGWWAHRRGHGWGASVLWFTAGCAFHSGIDILTHVTDGPVLFFPFNWQYRFPAPISYWDPAHGGREFSIFELTLDGLIVAYFALKFALRRLRPAPSA